MFEVYVKIELAQKVQFVTEQVCCSLQSHYTCLDTTHYSSMRTIIKTNINNNNSIQIHAVIIHINDDDIVLIFYNYYFNLQIQSEKRKMLHKFHVSNISIHSSIIVILLIIV